MVLSKSSALTSSSDGGTGAMPALFTRTSIRPKAATVVSTRAAQSLPVADVTPHRECLSPQGSDLGGHFLARIELAAGDDDIGTRFGEPQRHGPSKSLAPSGDDHDLVGWRPNWESSSVHRLLRLVLPEPRAFGAAAPLVMPSTM